jgi:PAS domain S-box-containing protein
MPVKDSELERAKALHHHIEKHGFDIEQLLQPGYEAVVLHSNSTIITGNHAAATLTGYAVEEMNGINAWTLFPPQSVNILMQKLAEGTEEPYQILAKRRNGQIIRIEIKGINFQLQAEPVRAVLLKQISH